MARRCPSRAERRCPAGMGWHDHKGIDCLLCLTSLRLVALTSLTVHLLCSRPLDIEPSRQPAIAGTVEEEKEEEPQAMPSNLAGAALQPCSHHARAARLARCEGMLPQRTVGVTSRKLGLVRRRSAGGCI